MVMQLVSEIRGVSKMRDMTEILMQLMSGMTEMSEMRDMTQMRKDNKTQELLNAWRCRCSNMG
jgi:hypothetical protein